MPVVVPISIADPPAPPAGYALCAFEVRSFTCQSVAESCAVFPGTAAGFEAAAGVLVRTAETVFCKEVTGMRLAAMRLAAVAWWADKPLHECIDGFERLVSVYDAMQQAWGKWTPEQRIGEAGPVPHPS